MVKLTVGKGVSVASSLPYTMQFGIVTIRSPTPIKTGNGGVIIPAGSTLTDSKGVVNTVPRTITVKSFSYGTLCTSQCPGYWLQIGNICACLSV